MNSDCFFSIGTTHKTCQDYARSGNVIYDLGDKTYHYVFLSDGCSSVIDTDIGSRLIVLAAEHNFMDYILNKSLMNNSSIFERAIVYANELAISENCLSSTLLKIIMNEKKCCVEIVGDGTIVVKRKNGLTSIISVSFPSGYPYYMTYTGKSLEEYLKQSPVFNKKVTVIDSFKNVSEEEVVVKNIAPYSLSFCESTSDIEFVAVFSDGIDSFYKTESDGTSIKKIPIDEVEVIKKCLDFKNFNGQFVQRRMQAFFRECKKLGWEHGDDFSVGTIYNGK